MEEICVYIDKINNCTEYHRSDSTKSRLDATLQGGPEKSTPFN